MKLKLDENLPLGLAADLRALGHDVDTVQDEGLVGFTDSDVWRAAQLESRFFISQDLDSSDIRLFGPGSHAGVLLVRLSQPQVRTHCVVASVRYSRLNRWRNGRGAWSSRPTTSSECGALEVTIFGARRST